MSQAKFAESILFFSLLTSVVNLIHLHYVFIKTQDLDIINCILAVFNITIGDCTCTKSKPNTFGVQILVILDRITYSKELSTILKFL
jgi:hypothetical protein